jgi:hypothetical protein
MKLLASNIRVQFNESRQPEIVLTVADLPEPINALKQAASDGKKLAVDITQHRQRRSLDANAYLWVMLAKMADVLHTNKDDLYLTMLGRYGQFTHVVVKAEAVDKFIQQWRVVRNLGGIRVNGVYGVQLQCYFGSSTYDTKEMATLIDGVVGECRDMGIETLPPDEIERMSQEWGR